jgi:hypothetical protein
MTVRDEREKAFWPLWRRWEDTPKTFLSELLDEFDAIDRRHPPEPVSVKREDDAPTDEQIAAWIERNPKAFADWAAKQARISGTAPARRRTRT